MYLIQILIDNKQHYKIFGRDVDLTSLIRLNIVEGKVVRHEDWSVPIFFEVVYFYFSILFPR